MLAGAGAKLLHYVKTEATSFYQRFGMEPTGEEFFKGNIPHVKFQKTL